MLAQVLAIRFDVSVRHLRPDSARRGRRRGEDED